MSTGRTTSQAKPQAGHRYAAMILGGLCLVTVYSYLRGQRNEPEWAGLVYYVIDYSDGLIRRALVGQGFMAFFTRAQSAQVWAAALTVHRAVCMLTMGGLVLWLWSVFWRRQRFTPARLALVYLIFAASQFLPTLAAINTYLDAYVFLLVLAAFWLAAQRREWTAACLGVVAPLIHEMSVIIWVSLILMVVWRDGTRGLLRPKIAAMCLAPFVGQALLMHFEVAAAVQSQLARAPLSPETRAAMANQQLGHKMLTELAIMIGLFRSHAVRATVSIVLYSAPTLMMLSAAGGALDRRGRALLAASAFVPLAILLVGYDLSRFVVITQLTAMLGILFITSSSPVGTVQSPVSRELAWAFGSIAAIMLLMPLAYGYFDRTMIIPNEVLTSLPGAGATFRRLYAAFDRLLA